MSDVKVALITAGGSGMGADSARALAADGFKVGILSSSGKGEALAKELGGVGITGTNKSEEDLQKLVDAAMDHWGRIDVLVNNAGITRDGLLMRMKTEDWQAVINLNLTGVFLCTRAVTRPMLKQRSGRIINITSVVGLMGNAGQANYAAAKAGVVGLTRSSAKEMASRGITVNAVAPGFIATDMTKDLEADAILSAIPLGRFGTPDQVAGTVRFLAADPAAAYITGQVLQVDGGMVMS